MGDVFGNVKKLKLQTVDRPCSKCGSDTAYGPEFCRGTGGNSDLGDHLRYYCTVCRHITSEPTKDQDTPERRKELAVAIERRQRARTISAEEILAQEGDRKRDTDIRSMYRQDLQGWRGR